jgi:hypothetical protein
LHGSYLVLSILTEPVWNYFSALTRLDGFPRLKAGISILATFSLVTFAWIFFRATSRNDALYIVNHLFRGWHAFLTQSLDVLREGVQSAADLGAYAIVDTAFKLLTPLTDESRTVLALTALSLVILLVIEILQYRGNLLQQLHQRPPYVRRIVYASLLAAMLILGTSYASVQQAFIYFQF